MKTRDIPRRVDVRRWLTRREWWLFALLLLSYVYFLPRYADWSQSSRIALVMAIVNEGRLEIDTYAHLTGDFAELNGHRYSDKAPGPAFLGIPVYAAARIVLDSPLFKGVIDRAARAPALAGTLKQSEAAESSLRFALAQMVVTWIVVAVPAAILAVCLYRMLGDFGLAEGPRLLITLAYALGTSAFPYAGNFYSHQLCASLLFCSFYLIWRQELDGSIKPLFIGTMLGLSIISEYPTGLIVIALIIYAVMVSRSLRVAAPILAGMLPPLGLMAIHNYAIFGTYLPVGYRYSTLWQAEHSAGFFSLTSPQLSTLWELTFSPYRGLFFLSPFLIFSVIGFCGMILARRNRAELAVCVWSAASLTALYSASVMASGGFAVGPRYLVPMLPFLALATYFAFAAFGHRAIFRSLFSLTVCISLVITWSETTASQSFPNYDPYPLWNLSWPALAAGDIARNLGVVVGLQGWLSLIPLAAFTGFALWQIERAPPPEREPVVYAPRRASGFKSLPTGRPVH